MSDGSILPKLPGPGDVVGEKYEIVGVVGRGGMGVVFEALHTRINQRVAVKMLHPHVRHEPGVIERFEREARAAGQLRSPHVARVLDVEPSGELPYIVMEFLEGHDLDDELATEGRLPVDRAVDAILQALVGIREAHGLGIIHRDLKPANLFRCAAGPEGEVIKVLDFGISKITTELDGRLTAAMTTLGSPVYMSPEQLRDGAEIDARADLWALGVVLFELISGKPPHTGTVTNVTAAIIADKAPLLSSVRHDIPPELDAVLARALEKDIHKRFQTAEELADALLPFASEEGARRLQAALTMTPAPPSSRRLAMMRTPAEALALEAAETRHSFTTASVPRPRSRAALWVALGAIGLGVVLGVGIFAVAKRGAAREAQPSEVTAVPAVPAVPAAAASAPAAAPAEPPAEQGAPEVASAAPAPTHTSRSRHAVKPAAAPPAKRAPAQSSPAKNPLRL